ncbi:MAG: hypothetical protein BM485_12705 [Desulfobulbaceae bacterium DB1]|nr:MAG: hypothetical protein BM485_12705 [Desulfobulbaceae bacterium DB1]
MNQQKNRSRNRAWKACRLRLQRKGHGEICSAGSLFRNFACITGQVLCRRGRWGEKKGISAVGKFAYLTICRENSTTGESEKITASAK